MAHHLRIRQPTWQADMEAQLESMALHQQSPDIAQHILITPPFNRNT
jgi:hypothetical protein